MNRKSKVHNCYTPIEGGYEIHLTREPSAKPSTDRSLIGMVHTERSVFGEGHAIDPLGQEDPRLHRRPLYPPADKTLLWDKQECERLARVGFRPLVLAYNEPRFLFDLHAAGGVAGYQRSSKAFSA